MLHRRKITRLIASFLLINITANIIFPVVSHASATGPNQAEHTSYQSPGSTDMVNLSTGDMTYTLPALDIPGADGGFSMPLSYNAGIGLNQEASWVGLGWSLNPGAISRNVAQYPDDASGEDNLINYKDDLDRGWRSNWGLVGFNWSVEKGHGGEVDLFGIISATVNNKDGMTSGHILGIGGANGKFDFNAAQMAEGIITIASFGASAAASGVAKAATSLGVSAATSVATSVIMNNVMPANTMSLGFMQPTYVEKKKAFHRDWWVFINESRQEKMFGSLYFQNAAVNATPSNLSTLYVKGTTTYKPSAFQGVYQSSDQGNKAIDQASDVYIAYNKYDEDKDWKYKYSTARPVNIAHDMFSVMGATVSGNIRPYRLEVGSVALPKRMSENHLKFNAIPYENYKVGFRYDGDISNAYDYHKGTDPAGEFKLGFSNTWDASKTVTVTDNSLYAQRIEGNRKGLQDRKLVTGKHIAWYSNEEILSAYDGNSQLVNQGLFLEWKQPTQIPTRTEQQCDPYTIDQTDGTIIFEEDCYTVTIPGTNNEFRSKAPAKGIGGFVITAEDGLTYHYSLPVYNFRQFTKATYRDNTDAFYTQSNPQKYATAWLLTAVTGPDFVDRGTPGLVDEQDWGYWVKFDYGKFASNYKWRSPYVGYSYNEDDNTLNSPSYTEGYKETYYLNKISTRSHTALFVKSVREDGRGHYTGSATLNPNLGNFNERFPSSSLKLDEVIVLTNEDYKKLSTANGIGSGVPAFNENTANNTTSSDASLKSGDTFLNVLDINDVNADSRIRDYISQNALKRVVFNYSYRLCRKTINSFVSAVTPPGIQLDDQANMGVNSNDRGGKLTLESVSMYGPNSFKLMPDFTFQYGDNPEYSRNKWDQWGFYNSAGTTSVNSHKASSIDADAASWSLKKIITPLGGTIEFDYERDTYSSVSEYPLGSNLTFNRQIYNPTVGSISFPNYTGDLRNYYQPGDLVYLYATVWKAYACPSSNLSEQQTGEAGGAYTLTKVTANQIEIANPPQVPNSSNPPANCLSVADKIEGYIGMPADRKGGDIRVSRIRTTDATGNTYQTKYNYGRSITAGAVSSGVVSKVPYTEVDNVRYLHLTELGDYPQTPVLYGRVNVINSIGTTDNFSMRTEYTFTTPRSEMVKINNPYMYQDEEYVGTLKKTRLYESNYINEISISQIGQPRSIKKYNGNNKLEQTTTLGYSNAIPNNSNVANYANKQGVFTEGVMTNELILAWEQQGNDIWWTQYHKLFRTSKKYIPSVLVSQTTTKGTISNTASTQLFDFLTGQVLESQQTDALGNTFVSVEVPAYEKYPEMGSKTLNPLNKNMMVQPTASYVYRVQNGQRSTAPVSVAVQTWKGWDSYRSYDEATSKYLNKTEGPKIWRKQEAWVWDGRELNADGTLKGFSTSTDFNWSSLTQLSPWLKVGETAAYDHYSASLMSKDMNGNFAASKKGYNQQYTIANASNARYTEIVYSGAEDKTMVAPNVFHFGGEVRDADKQSSDVAHTGLYSVKLQNGEHGFRYTALAGDANDPATEIETGRTYRISAWIHRDDFASKAARLYVQYTDAQGAHILKQVGLADPGAQLSGNWYLVNAFVDIPASINGQTLTVGATNTGATPVYIDDFRFHPIDAPMTGYVYNPKTWQVTHILDNDNIYTFYEYDDAGILIKTYQERLGETGVRQQLSEKKYNYARPK
ncbi:hypothetical protein [Xanthocytophaga agilis]|uniref:Uncharacterized protein n=1 Tax=Xanthocytophaga agilis TaxID=3048010 RepID=A0AAE3R418_9BACT|nr:hypothetical protein [Xanthocytophaga agilis]MDJ1501169.1 hypothetical protein [Xanthocytophaga agilis]